MQCTPSRAGIPKGIVALLAFIGVLLATWMTGCSEEPPTATTGRTTPETPAVSSVAPTITSVGGLGPATSFIGLMELIPLPPDGDNWQSVYLNDYKRMRRAHGIQAPENNAVGADLEKYLSRVFEETGATGPWLSGYDPRAREVPVVKGYLRFDIGEVEGSIWAEDVPPDT